MPIAYYGSRISPHMTKTDEGYLICHDVPINRIGVQDYIGDELGLDDNNMHKVLRRPEEVFSPQALASFEGKAVTDNHPPETVMPNNIQFYGKGHAQNIRKGSGKNAGTSIADLFITDPQLIREIQNGKRDISCGYTYDLIPNKNGTYEQRNIRGNHIAVVDEGRAGHRVSIKDEKPNLHERGNTMPNESKGSLKGRIMKILGRDESISPEDLEKVSKMEEPKETKGETPEIKKPEIITNEEKAEEKPEAEDESSTDELLKQVISLLSELRESLEPQEPAESEDALEDIVNSEKKPEDKPDESTEEQEPSVTIPAEKITEKEKPAAMDEMRKTAAITQGILRKAIKDPKAYKMAAKDAATELRKQFNIPKDNSGYANFIHGTSQAAKTRAARDAANRREKELADVQKMYDSMNPHNKEAK